MATEGVHLKQSYITLTEHILVYNFVSLLIFVPKKNNFDTKNGPLILADGAFRAFSLTYE